MEHDNSSNYGFKQIALERGSIGVTRADAEEENECTRKRDAISSLNGTSRKSYFPSKGPENVKKSMHHNYLK